MTFDYTVEFTRKLAEIKSADPICAEMIQRECGFFAREAKPATDIYDVYDIKVEHLGGQLIATLLIIVFPDHILFFDLLEADQIHEESE